MTQVNTSVAEGRRLSSAQEEASGIIVLVNVA
jgi:hypothetical protein